MKLLKLVALGAGLFTFNQTSFAQTIAINKKLVVTIDSLKNADQAPASMQNGKEAEEAFKKVTRSNLPLIKSIAQTYGFPGYNLVGKESSDSYWLLVQHSDFDLSFQKQALDLMRIQVDRKNASGSNYAYLVDRININEGKPQVYGTQVNMGQTGTKLKPCIDTTNLDSRRLAVGLPPIKEYLKKCDDYFQEMNKERFNKAKTNR